MSDNESSTDQRKVGNLKEINEQASQADSDDTVRRGVRGDETKGDPDERDAAGGVHHRDTPHGREEAKNDTSNKANTNG